MKRFILISMIAIAAAGMTGCGEEDGTVADLQWNNQAGSQVETIQWVSNGQTNQTWDGVWADGSTTSPKGISELTGQGECLDSGGSPATIQVDSSSTGGAGVIADGATGVSIQENATANLVIQGTTVIVK